MATARVCDLVHYVSYGTPGGEYTSQCRAAIVAAVPTGALPVVDSEHAQAWDSDTIVADLAVLNPTGLFFNRAPHAAPSGQPRGGTWHHRHECDPDHEHRRGST